MKNILILLFLIATLKIQAQTYSDLGVSNNGIALDFAIGHQFKNNLDVNLGMNVLATNVDRHALVWSGMIGMKIDVNNIDITPSIGRAYYEEVSLIEFNRGGEVKYYKGGAMIYRIQTGWNYSDFAKFFINGNYCRRIYFDAGVRIYFSNL